MAGLRDTVREHQDELRNGIAWVAFWREGRSWNADYFYFETDDALTFEEKSRLKEIMEADPAAVILNSYYCGQLAEDMTVDELAAGVRHHYENGFNRVDGFMEAHDDSLSPEEIEQGRAAAHAAGLPFSEKPYRAGEEFDPYVFDGSMSVEDYELMQHMREKERSDRMEQPIISGYLSNLGKYAEGRPAGEWVTFPTTAERMKEAFARIGLDFKNYEEWHFTEFQSSVPGLAERLGEYSHPDELNYLSGLLSDLDEGQREKFKAAAEHGEYAGSLQDLINLAQNLDCYEFFPSVHSEEDYGYFLIDNLGTIALPEEAKKYFDYEAYGSDTIINEGGDLTDGGYIYTNRSPFTEHYNGRDVPQEYRVTPQPQQPDLELDGAQPEPAAPRPVIPIIPTSSDSDKKLKEITDRLEQGITELFDSERYTDYLRVMSKFPQYSLRNTVLIAMQAPDASYVMGFDAWKDPAIGRHVKANEKGIRIIAPRKAKKQVEKIDPDTKKPVLDSDGKPVMEEKEIIIPKFKVVCVYDVAQTEGKELPTLADELTGDVAQYKELFAALEKTSPFPIHFEALNGGRKGGCFYDEQRIVINEGMSELQNVKTAIHEIAHATLHDTGILSEGAPDKRTREIQAESVAYAVCQHYGLDTSDYSFGYLAGWSSRRELAELKGSLETIRQTAANLIEAIDGHLSELQQEQGKEQAAEQAQETPAPKQPDKEQSAEQPAPQGAESPVFDNLTPEKQTELSGEVQATLQMLIDADIAAHGEVTAGTLEAVQTQGYSYENGQLAKAEPETPDSGQPPEQHAAKEQTDLQKKAVEIAARYEKLSLQEKIDVIAQPFGCTTGKIETSPCTGKWRGTSDMFIRFDNGASLFIGNCLTPQAKTVKARNEYVSRALAQYNPEIVSAAKEAAFTALKKREGKDNEIAAQKGLKPYTLLSVEFCDGADKENHGVMGWYYVTLAVDGKICTHLETGLNYDISDGKVSETPAKAAYYAAGALKEAEVDYVFNNVGFSSTSTLYSLPVVSDRVRERAEKALAQQEAPKQAAAPYYSINEGAARRAKEMNSYSDYKPGSATAEYRHYVDEAVKIAERQKSRVDPIYHEKIDSLLDAYARRLAANMNKGYEIDARVPSILIAGGSNFPVRKKEKQNAARDRNMEDWQEVQGLLDKIRSTGMGGISADDPQAVPKLESKLAKLEQAQETMKAVNAYYRKHKTLDGCPHLSPDRIEKMKADMSSQWHIEDKPYPTWALSNNSAEIRRVKERIKSLTSQKAIGFVGWEFDGGRVEANTDANRLQIVFDEKPDEETREALKSNGFRWSPKAEAWQRQLTDNAYYGANYIQAIQPLSGEKPTDLLRAHIRQQKAAAQAQPAPQEQTQREPDAPTPDRLETGETVQTPRGTFYITAMTREQMEAAGYGFHHQSEDGKYLIMGNGTRAFAIAAQPENPLKSVEQSTEQNCNMIDGVINNTPSTAELEAKIQAGEQISLTDYANALKAEQAQGRGEKAPEKKPSIRAQLAAAKKQAAPKKAAEKSKSHEMEV